MHPQQARCPGKVAGGAAMGLHQAFWGEFQRDWRWRNISWLRTRRRTTIEVGKRRGSNVDSRRGSRSGWQTPWQDTVRSRIGRNEDRALGQRCLTRHNIPGTRRELRTLFDPLIQCLPPNYLTNSLHVDALQHITQLTDVPGPVIVGQQGHGIGRQTAYVTVVLLVQEVQEMGHQQG